MILRETELKGAYVIDIEELSDDRGFFARAFCQREFDEHGLSGTMVQANISSNRKKGTLRGLHYQAAPCEEAKLVRCTQGAIYDVLVDLRKESATYLRWLGVELTPDNHRMLYVPARFVHGFQTLQDDTEVFYQVSEFYAPESERGARYNDPAFGITWPLEVSVLSSKDANWAEFLV